MRTRHLHGLFFLGAGLLVFGLAVFAKGWADEREVAEPPAVAAAPSAPHAPPSSGAAGPEAMALEHEQSALGLLGAVTGAGILVVAWQRRRRLETAAGS